MFTLFAANKLNAWSLNVSKRKPEVHLKSSCETSFNMFPKKAMWYLKTKEETERCRGASLDVLDSSTCYCCCKLSIAYNGVLTHIISCIYVKTGSCNPVKIEFEVGVGLSTLDRKTSCDPAANILLNKMHQYRLLYIFPPYSICFLPQRSPNLMTAKNSK